MQVRGDVLYLVPQKLIPRDQAWFWSRGWQEWEADDAIAEGELSDLFESAEDLVAPAGLNSPVDEAPGSPTLRPGLRRDA